MLLKPKNTKNSKSQKGRLSPITIKPNVLGAYALIARQPGRIKAVHIAAATLAIKRKLKIDKGLSQFNLRIFPHVPVTKKPAEVRMGKGKGNVDYWMTRVRPGTVLFEIVSSSPTLAKFAFQIASSKLPIKTTFMISPLRRK